MLFRSSSLAAAAGESTPPCPLLGFMRHMKSRMSMLLEGGAFLFLFFLDIVQNNSADACG